MPNRVSEAQWETILEFLTRHPQLARTGYNNTARGRAESRRLWAEVALVLNAQGTGATKDALGWSKYYHDKRSKLKNLVGGNRTDSTGTGGGPPQRRPLTEQEERWCGILGEWFGQGEANVRVNPFASQPWLPHPSTSQQSSTSQSQSQTTVPGEPESVDYPIVVIVQDDSPSAEVQPSPGPVQAPSAIIPTEPAPAHPLPRSSRQRQRARTRPLGPLEQTRRVLSQIEQQRVQSDIPTAAASARLAESIGELARQHGRVADELSNIRMILERFLNN